MSGERPVAAPARPGGGGPMGHGRMMGGGGPVEKSMDFTGSGKRLLRNLRPERPRVIALFSLGALSVALTVTGPKLLGQATDLIFAGIIGRQLPAGVPSDQAAQALRAQGQSSLADLVGQLPVVPGFGIDFGAVARVLLITLGIYVIASVLSLAQGLLAAQVVQRSVYRMRADAEAKLSRLPLRYFDRQPLGEVLSRVTNDIDNIAQTLQQSMSQLVTSLLMLIGVLAMMFWISPLLAVVVLVTVPLSIVAAAQLGKRAQPQFVRQWATTGQLNGHIEEMITGHGLVTLFGQQEESAAKFATHNEKLFAASARAQFASGSIQPALMFLGNLSYVLVAVIGGLRVASGSLSLGDVQAFIQYSRSFSQPLTTVASMANLLQSGVASAERVFALMDEPEQSGDPATGNDPDRVQGCVAFEDVSFRYEPDTPLIDGLSLAVEPGDTVAIVGPTGAGKTTLVNLVMRFYELTGGRITLDGIDIATLPRERLRRHVGMVLQDTWLFGGTIADNIAYGNPASSRDEVIAAAQTTQVDRFVRTLPHGYDTVIEEDSEALSAGEKQLVTIARAFLADPEILILDEATSSVDTRTEVLIQHALAQLRTGRTSFVIAHRLSTIRDANLILVMENGTIVEQGNHADLLAADGAYRRLYEAQFAHALVEAD